MHCFVFANSFTMLFLIQNLCVTMVLMANQGLSHMNEQEPQSSCRFDYEYKVLQKLLDSEHANKEQNQQIEELVKNNLDLKNELGAMKDESKETIATLQSSLNENKEQNQQIDELIKNNLDLKTELDAMKEESKETVAALQSSLNGTKEQNRQIEELIKNNSDLQNELDAMKEESKATVATLQSSLDVSNHAIGYLTSQVKNLSSSSSDGDQRPFYGFSAYESSSSSSSRGSTIIFKHTRLNEGGVYNTGTGQFTVPVDGIYVFHATLCTHYNKAIHVAFMEDEEVLGKFSSNDKDWGTCGSGTALAHLQKGSQVFLKVTSVSSGSVLLDNSYHMNSFSGFLVAK